MTFGIYTLGCRVNQYESRIIAQQLINKGHIELSFDSPCDTYIINTCAVTAESVRKSRQIIRRAIKYNKNARIIVTGCFAQISPDEVSKIHAKCHVIGNKSKIASVMEAVYSASTVKIASNFEDADYENYLLESHTRHREYIKIQDGCEGKCTYCIIPQARGPIRSKPFDSVIKEVNTLAKSGVKEVILTGIEIASYEYGLADLLKQIDLIEGIERISLGSLEPTLITEEFAETLKGLKKLTPHFHISVQSGSSSVLNRMKRKYNARMLINKLDILKNKFDNLQLTCDIIVGFPGETEEEFAETKDFLLNNKFIHAHIFPYSIRPGTPAAEMPGQLPDNIKNQRVSELYKQQNIIKNELLNKELDRKSVQVLFETFKDGINTGHSDNYIEYSLESDCDLTGCMMNVIPTKVINETIYSVMA